MRFSLNMSILGKTDQTTPHGHDKRWADLIREQFSMRLYALKIDPRDVMPVEDRFNMIQLKYCWYLAGMVRISDSLKIENGWRWILCILCQV